MLDDRLDDVIDKLSELRKLLRHGTGIVNRYLRDMIEEAFTDAIILDALKYDGALDQIYEIERDCGYDASRELEELIEKEKIK